MTELTATRTEEHDGYQLLYTDDRHAAITNNGLDWLSVTPDSCSCPLFAKKGSCKHIPLAFGLPPARPSVAQRPSGAPSRRRTASQPTLVQSAPVVPDFTLVIELLNTLADGCGLLADWLDPHHLHH